jgi:hypothetical protein
MTVAIKTLAKEFSRELHATLTPEQMFEVLRRNGQEAFSTVCHTHDFCDANMVIYKVFKARGMDPAAEGGMERWGHLWDGAWNLAKRQRFAVR